MVTAEAISISASKAVVLVGGRGETLARERLGLSEGAAQLGMQIAGEGAGRRRKTGRAVSSLRDALPPGVRAIILLNLSVLSKDPLDALGLAADLVSLGLELHVLEQKGLAGAETTLVLLAEWARTCRRAHRAEVAKAALASARNAGRRIGRPRKSLPPVDVLRFTVETIGAKRAAEQWNVGESTLRRALHGSGAAASRPSSPTPPPNRFH